jgi:hypothetical protein
MSVNLLMMDLLGLYPYQTLAAIFFGYVLLRQLRNSNPNRLPLPPGPKGYPLIGNVFDFPVKKPWLVYEEWCKAYGKLDWPFRANTSNRRFR